MSNLSNKFIHNNYFLVKYFHTAGQVVDFAHYKSDVIKIINQWVGLNTNGMIDSLVTDSDVKESTKLVLANALSFDGKWASRFESQKSILFKKDNGESLTLPGMAQACHHHYYHSDELKYSTIQLDYADKYSMIVILPDETDGLSSLMTQFSAGEFKNMLAKAENKAVDVTIPKFKMNYDMSDAADRLSRMGLSNIFSENANFSLLASESLHIERILHKAVIDVDQEGTRAAAATGLVAASDTGQLDTEINFIADHPFAFALIHNTTKTILFYGQYYGK